MEKGLLSDIKIGALDEAGGQEEGVFVAPEFLLQGGAMWPVFYSGFLVERAGLQDMLWGLWACLARAIRCVRQTKAMHVGTQSAVSSP